MMDNKERHNCNDCIKEDVCEWAVYSDVINCNKFVDKQVLERTQGYWINPSLNHELRFKELFYDCSICKHTNISESNFCPKCGADMRKEIKDD